MFVEKAGKDRAKHPLEKGAIRSDPRQDTNSEQLAEKHPRKVFGGLGFRDYSFPLARRHAAQKERFDVAQKRHDDLLKIAISGNVLQGRINEHTSLPALISDRSLNDFREERSDRIVRRQGALKSTYPFSKGLLKVTVESASIEGPLVPKGVVQTCPGYTHFASKIPNRSRFVTAEPELLDSGVENGAFVKFTRSGHFAILLAS